MAEPSTGADDTAPWMPLSEAAERSGRHIDALRSLVRRKRLPAKKGNAGQWLVQLPPELAEPSTRPDKVTDLGSDEVISGLMAEVTELREQLARSQAEAHATRDTAGAQVAAVRAEVAAKDQLIVELKAMLAEARRPWFARWWRS
jgi:hypothetical protein